MPSTWICALFGISCVVSGPARILDGDTLAIGTTHVRLAGIDAEELSEPNGYAAKRQLERLTEGFAVTCQLGQWSYNRRVGVCTTGESTLNAAMVASGAALDCARYSGGIYRALEPAGARDRLRQKVYCKFAR